MSLKSLVLLKILWIYLAYGLWLGCFGTSRNFDQFHKCPHVPGIVLRAVDLSENNMVPAFKEFVIQEWETR